MGGSSGRRSSMPRWSSSLMSSGPVRPLALHSLRRSSRMRCRSSPQTGISQTRPPGGPCASMSSSELRSARKAWAGWKSCSSRATKSHHPDHVQPMCGQPQPASFFMGNMCTRIQATAPQAPSATLPLAFGPRALARSPTTVSRTRSWNLLALARSQTASVATRVRGDKGPSFAARRAARTKAQVTATRFSRTQASMARASCCARLPPPVCQAKSAR
mmetsp:Transcript_105437/g.340069  ORF Transcript_105437/g.340069 Transcript_105437/m.340069 type:complete len:217 (+) Transcript_105437:114-764(+)